MFGPRNDARIVGQIEIAGYAPMAVAEVSLQDSAAIGDLWRACTPETLRRRFHNTVNLHTPGPFMRYLVSDDNNATSWAVWNDGRMVAVGSGWHSVTRSELALLVRTDMQRKGIGTALTEATRVALRGVPELVALTELDNSGAVFLKRLLVS